MDNEQNYNPASLWPQLQKIDTLNKNTGHHNI